MVLGIVLMLAVVAAVVTGLSMARGTGPVALVADTVGGGSGPPQFRDRPALASCGRVELGQGERVRDVGPDELACLRRAFEDGTGAELVVVSPTTEGDPVTDYRRVLADGTTEVWTDMTEDQFGGGWDHGSCATPSGPLESVC